MKIQSELKVPKNQFNKYGGYKYRSCEDIMVAVKPLLEQYGCLLTVEDDLQVLTSDEGVVTKVEDKEGKTTEKKVTASVRVYVKATATIVDIETGQETKASAFAREAIVKKGMDDSQITGTASSYARKYALAGLFLLDDGQDDDSLKGAGDQQKKKPAAKPAAKKTAKKKQDSEGLLEKGAVIARLEMAKSIDTLQNLWVEVKDKEDEELRQMFQEKADQLNQKPELQESSKQFKNAIDWLLASNTNTIDRLKKKYKVTDHVEKSLIAAVEAAKNNKQ